MALVLTLYPYGEDNDIYIDGVHVVATARDTASSYDLVVHQGIKKVFHISPQQAQEILPDVFVYGGEGRFDTGRNVIVCIDAPREIPVMRGKLYREKV